MCTKRTILTAFARWLTELDSSSVESVPGGPVNARLESDSIVRATDCDSSARTDFPYSIGRG